MPRDGSATRERILQTAERLVIDNGFAATSVDQVIAESATSKGAFFHHFESKQALAASLVERYAAADLAHLERALALTADVADPRERLLAFLQLFEDEADELMSAQSSCLYVAVLTERQLVIAGTAGPIREAVQGWRTAIAHLVRAAAPDTSVEDADALADHVFVTFEGAFLLARAESRPGQMRRQLRALRLLVTGLLGATAPVA